MIAVFYITGVLLMLYMSYPLFIGFYTRKRPADEKNPMADINGVSLILLTYNGQEYLEEKIRFLLDELTEFQKSELIIIDDHSTDDTRNIIEGYKNDPGIKIILKPGQKGIAHSMNLGVQLAEFDYIIFSDQRQQLCRGSLHRIVQPLRQSHIGAVSGCISSRDKANGDSLERRHENYIKSCESAMGNLIGVYGPLYAIHRNSFEPIPEDVILDDLYLSLRILKSRRIVLINDCAIIDEKFSVLYNYKRTKRYLTGLLQILFNKTILHDLSSLQFLMLMWHKYLRLLLPVLLSLCYLFSGILMQRHWVFLTVFVMMNILGVLALMQMATKFQSRIINIVRVNLYYMFAIIDLSFATIGRKIFE